MWELQWPHKPTLGTIYIWLFLLYMTLFDEMRHRLLRLIFFSNSYLLLIEMTHFRYLLIKCNPFSDKNSNISFFFIVDKSQNVRLWLAKFLARNLDLCREKPMVVCLLCSSLPISILLHQCLVVMATSKTDRSERQRQKKEKETWSKYFKDASPETRLVWCFPQISHSYDQCFVMNM